MRSTVCWDCFVDGMNSIGTKQAELYTQIHTLRHTSKICSYLDTKYETTPITSNIKRPATVNPIIASLDVLQIQNRISSFRMDGELYELDTTQVSVRTESSFSKLSTAWLSLESLPTTHFCSKRFVPLKDLLRAYSRVLLLVSKFKESPHSFGHDNFRWHVGERFYVLYIRLRLTVLSVVPCTCLMFVRDFWKMWVRKFPRNSRFHCKQGSLISQGICDDLISRD